MAQPHAAVLGTQQPAAKQNQASVTKQNKKRKKKKKKKKKKGGRERLVQITSSHLNQKCAVIESHIIILQQCSAYQGGCVSEGVSE